MEVIQNTIKQTMIETLYHITGLCGEFHPNLFLISAFLLAGYLSTKIYFSLSETKPNL